MGNDQQKNKHQGDENTRPSVGKDQPQDLQEGMPPAAQQQNQGQKPGQQDESTRLAELRKAAKEDMVDPDNPQGQENTETSAGP